MTAGVRAKRQPGSGPTPAARAPPPPAPPVRLDRRQPSPPQMLRQPPQRLRRVAGWPRRAGRARGSAAAAPCAPSSGRPARPARRRPAAAGRSSRTAASAPGVDLDPVVEVEEAARPAAGTRSDCRTARGRSAGGAASQRALERGRQRVGRAAPALDRQLDDLPGRDQLVSAAAPRWVEPVVVGRVERGRDAERADERRSRTRIDSAGPGRTSAPGGR